MQRSGGVAGGRWVCGVRHSERGGRARELRMSGGVVSSGAPSWLSRRSGRKLRGTVQDSVWCPGRLGICGGETEWLSYPTIPLQPIDHHRLYFLDPVLLAAHARDLGPRQRPVQHRGRTVRDARPSVVLRTRGPAAPTYERVAHELDGDLDVIADAPRSLGSQQARVESRLVHGARVRTGRTSRFGRNPDVAGASGGIIPRTGAEAA